MPTILIFCISSKFQQEIQESVLFHLVLKAYPICHSWIITSHIFFFFFIGRFGETMEDVHVPEGKITVM